LILLGEAPNGGGTQYKYSGADLSKQKFVETDGATDSISRAVGKGEFDDNVTATVVEKDTYYLKLGAGDLVLIYDGDGYKPFISAPVSVLPSDPSKAPALKCNVVAFFVDLNQDNKVQANELTGMSLGNNAQVQVGGAVYGDVVSNFNDVAGKLGGASETSGAATDLLANSISMFSATAVTGQIISGGSINGIRVSGEVGRILSGDAADGLKFNFFAGADDTRYTGRDGGDILSVIPQDGKTGVSIANVSVGKVGSSVAAYSAGLIQAGNGGAGGAGGSITGVAVFGDTDGFTMQAGRGGRGVDGRPSGGPGGALSDVLVYGPKEFGADPTANSAFIFRAGGGGDGTLGGAGGAGGAVSSLYFGYELLAGKKIRSTVTLSDTVLVEAGSGGLGRTGGKGGGISLAGVLSSPTGAGNDIKLLAGTGGVPYGTGGVVAGDGGSISQVVVGNPGATLGGQLSEILIEAGDAGVPFDITSRGGVGGSVTNANLAGFIVKVNAGYGSSGITGGAGGSITNIQISGGREDVVLPVSQVAFTNVHPDQVLLRAGGGGSGSEGGGGAGGSVAGVTVLGANLSVFDVNQGALDGCGGRSKVGNGGLGGSVSNIQVTDNRDEVAGPDKSAQLRIKAGDGGLGGEARGNAGGVGGSVLSCQFSGVDISLSLVAGIGGTVSPKTPVGNGGAGGSVASVAFNATGLVGGLPPGVTITAGSGGAAVGTGISGAGGGLDTLQLNVPGSVALTAGNGGAGAAIGASGRGGSVSNVSAISSLQQITVAAGSAGSTGLKAVDGGLVKTGHFGAATTLSVIAGDGFQGGGGGGVSGIVIDPAAGAAMGAAALTLRAGKGSGLGLVAGVGGSVTKVTGFVPLSGITSITAGGGGGGVGKAADGGSVSSVFLFGGGGAGAELTIEAGNGGSTTNGANGGNGGAVNGVAIQPLGAGTILRQLVAGDGGSTLTGKLGGNGGSVTDVAVRSDIGVRSGVSFGYGAMGGIFSGAFGSGALKNGVSGDVRTIRATAISSIVAGKLGVSGVVDVGNLANRVSGIVLGAAGVPEAVRVDAFGNYVNFATASVVGGVVVPVNATSVAYPASGPHANTFDIDDYVVPGIAGPALVNCGLTDGSPFVSCANTAGLVVGMEVSGDGIAPGARVVSITNNVGFTLSADAHPVIRGAITSVDDSITFAADPGLLSGQSVYLSGDPKEYFVIKTADPKVVQLAATQADAMGPVNPLVVVDLVADVASAALSVKPLVLAGAITAVDDQVTFAVSHGMSTGQSIFLDGAQFFVIGTVDPTKIQLAATRADALAGVPVAVNLPVDRPVAYFTVKALRTEPGLSTVSFDVDDFIDSGAAAGPTLANCGLTDGSPVVACSNTAGLVPGMYVSAEGIAAGTRITSVVNNVSFTMSTQAHPVLHGSITAASDTVSFASSHGLASGQSVLLDGAEFFVITTADPKVIKLAASQANAQAPVPVAVDLLLDRPVADFTLNPLHLQGTITSVDDKVAFAVNHGLSSGQSVFLDGMEFFAIATVDPKVVQLASSKADALASTPVPMDLRSDRPVDLTIASVAAVGVPSVLTIASGDRALGIGDTITAKTDGFVAAKIFDQTSCNIRLEALLTLSGRLDGLADIGSAVNADADPSVFLAGRTASSVTLGALVTVGDFQVNGKSVPVTAKSTLQDVIAGISAVTAKNVSARYDFASDRFVLESAGPISLAAGTSNFLAAAKLAANGTGSVQSASSVGLLSQLVGLKPATAVTGGTFTVNGQTISVAPTAKVSDIVTAISQATAGPNVVTTSYNFATDQIELKSAGAITLAAGTSNFLTALKLASNGTGAVQSSSPVGLADQLLTVKSLRLGTAVAAGNFTVNGASVVVNPAGTLRDVFDAISKATSGVVSATYNAATDQVELTSTGALTLVDGTSKFLTAMKLAQNGTSSVRSASSLGVVDKTKALTSAGLKTAPGSAAGTLRVNGSLVSFDPKTDSMTTLVQKINAAASGVVAGYDAVQDRMTLVASNPLVERVFVAEAATALSKALGLTSPTLLGRLEGAADIGSAVNVSADPSVFLSGRTAVSVTLGAAVTAGDFQVNGQLVSVTAQSTIQDVIAGISAATASTVSARYDLASDQFVLESAGPIALAAGTSNFLAAAKLVANGTGSVQSTSSVGLLSQLVSLKPATVVTSGTFKVNGLDISVAPTAKLSDIFTAISQATAGPSLVTASYNFVSDRIELSSAGPITLAAGTSNFLTALKLASNGTGAVQSSASVGLADQLLTVKSLRLGTAVAAGNFTVNGVPVVVNPAGTLRDVFDSISRVTSGVVSATYNAATDQVELTSTGALALVDGTSKFLAATKLIQNGTSVVRSSSSLGVVDQSKALASAGFKTATGSAAGSFLLNGSLVSYDPKTDSLTTLVQKINAVATGVVVGYDAAQDRVTFAAGTRVAEQAFVNGIGSVLSGALGLTFAPVQQPISTGTVRFVDLNNNLGQPV